MLSSLLRRCRATYQSFPRQFWLIATGLLISSVGSGLIWPFQLIYVSQKLGIKIAAVATLITISSSAGLVASFIGGSIADRIGRKPIMFGALLANGFGYILMVFSSSYLGFLIPMTILALSMPLYSVGSDSMLADMVPAEQRVEGYAILRMIHNAGLAIGPAIGGFIVYRSYAMAFSLAAGSILFSSLLLFVFVKETLIKGERVLPDQVEKESSGGFSRVLKDRFFLIFVLIVTIGMIGPLMLWMLLPIYTKQNFALPEYRYSWIPITNAVMCVFVQFPVTRIVRKYRPLPTIAVGMLLYAMGVGSVAWVSTLPGFVMSMVILTFGELIVIPTGTTYVANRAPSDLRGRYMSVYWLTWGLARAIAPIIGGLLNDQISPRAVWHGGLVIGLISTLGLMLLVRKNTPINTPEPEEDPCAPAAG